LASFKILIESRFKLSLIWVILNNFCNLNLPKNHFISATAKNNLAYKNVDYEVDFF